MVIIIIRLCRAVPQRPCKCLCWSVVWLPSSITPPSSSTLRFAFKRTPTADAIAGWTVQWITSAQIETLKIMETFEVPLKSVFLENQLLCNMQRCLSSNFLCLIYLYFITFPSFFLLHCFPSFFFLVFFE